MAQLPGKSAFFPLAFIRGGAVTPLPPGISPPAGFEWLEADFGDGNGVVIMMADFGDGNGVVNMWGDFGP